MKDLSSSRCRKTGPSRDFTFWLFFSVMIFSKLYTALLSSESFLLATLPWTLVLINVHLMVNSSTLTPASVRDVFICLEITPSSFQTMWTVTHIALSRLIIPGEVKNDFQFPLSIWGVHILLRPVCNLFQTNQHQQHYFGGPEESSLCHGAVPHTCCKPTHHLLIILLANLTITFTAQPEGFHHSQTHITSSYLINKCSSKIVLSCSFNWDVFIYF